MGDNDSEIVEEFVVDAGGRTGGEAKKRAGAEESGKKCKEEVEAEFGCAAKEVICEKALPCADGDDPDRSTLQIPEGTQGGVGDIIPDALLTRVRRFDEGVVGWDGGFLG